MKKLFNLLTLVMIWSISLSFIQAKTALQHDEGINIHYHVQIDDYATHEAIVTMRINNIHTKVLEIEELGWGDRNIQGQIQWIEAMAPDGSKIKMLKEDRDAYGYSIAVSGLEEITIKYSIKKDDVLTNNHNVMGYIGEDFGVFSGGQLLLATKEKYILNEITLEFKLPMGSVIAVPFYEQDGVYYPTYYSKKDESVWDSAYMSLYASTLGVGNFKEVKGPIIGETQITTYVHANLNYSDRLANNIEQVISYQTELFGSGATEEMVEYNAIIFPYTGIHAGVWSGESAFSQGIDISYNSEPKHDFYAHQTFHRWNGWIWGFDIKSNTAEEKFFRVLMNEGLNRYYEGKFIIMNSEKLFNVREEDVQYLTRIYEDYMEEMPQDPSLMEGNSPYDQGSLFFLYLDMDIMRKSNGQISLDDVVERLYHRYAHRKEKMTYQGVIDCIKDITTIDYTDVFDEFIYKEGGIGKAIQHYMQDDDGDRIENYIEMLKGFSNEVVDRYNVIDMEYILNSQYGDPSMHKKDMLIVGSKEQVDEIRAAGNNGDGVGVGIFIEQELYTKYLNYIIVLDYQIDNEYYILLKQIVPGLVWKQGTYECINSGTCYTIIID